MLAQKRTYRPASLGVAALLAICPLMGQTERIVVSGFETPESVVHDRILVYPQE